MTAARWRAPALALLALFAPAAAQQAPPQSGRIPVGPKDCLNPALRVVDSFNLNTPTHQITRAPDVSGSRAAAAAAGAAAAAAAVGADGSAYDAHASIIGNLNPTWMRPDANGRLRPPPVTNFSRVPAADALRASEELGAKLLAASAAARAFAAAADAGNGSAAAAAAGAASLARATSFRPTTVQVADLFKIDYYGTWKLVTNLVTGEIYVLYQCGTPDPTKPNPLDANSVAVSLPPNAKVFRIPLSSLVIPDTTALAYTSNLKLQDRYLATPSFCVDACGQFVALRCKATAIDTMSYTVWPNLYPLASAVVQVEQNAADPLAISVSAAATSPILKPQWLKFVGAFFNREGQASSNADSAARSYSARRATVQQLAGRFTPAKVLWTSHMDVWFDWGYPRNGQQFVISGDQYKKAYVADAGGSFIDGRALRSQFPSVADWELWSRPGAGRPEEFCDVAINLNSNPAEAKRAMLWALRQAEVIVDESYFARPVNAPNMQRLMTRWGLSQAEFNSLPAVQNNRVFTIGRRLSGDGMGSDWYETAVLETDQVLGDFIQAVTPAALTTPNRKLKFLHRVSLGDGEITYVNPLSCPYYKTCGARRVVSTCPNVWYNCANGVFTYGARIGHCPSTTCRPTCYCCGPDAGTARCAAACGAANRGMCANPQ